MHLSMSPGTTPSITLGSAIQILQEKREEEKERERERENQRPTGDTHNWIYDAQGEQEKQECSSDRLELALNNQQRKICAGVCRSTGGKAKWRKRLLIPHLGPTCTICKSSEFVLWDQ